MLKTIHPLLAGDLLAILSDMGHGDEVVIVDANFPAAACARRLVRLPASSATEALRVVLSVFPLDDFVTAPAAAMAAPETRPPLYDEFDSIIAEAEGRPVDLALIDRFDFYDRSRAAYAVIATGEARLYGNVILKKGVLRGRA